MKINTSAKGLFALVLLGSVTLVAGLSRAQDDSAKPELSVQPAAPAEAQQPPAQPPAAAPVVKEPAEANPPAINPLDSVAQGLSATATPLPIKAPIAKEEKPAASGNSSAAHPTQKLAPAKPSGLKPMGPSLKNVQGEKLAQATGHFARARSLLIAALGEFDKGLELANPDALFSSSDWRSDVTARARDIEHILAPQPRETTGGIKFQADPRLLGEAKR